MNARRLAVRILLASVLVSALLGVFAILGGEMGETSIKVLLTSVTISFVSLLAMASFSAWQTQGGFVFSRVGISASVAAGVLIISGIWFSSGSELLWKLTLSLMILAIAGAHGSMLSLARLIPQHQWIRPFGHGVGTLLVATLLALIWEVSRGMPLGKLIGVLVILDAASTLAIVVFHVLGRIPPPVTGGDAVVYFCPGCGKRLWLPAGEVRCHHCEERYFVAQRPKGTDLPPAIVTAPKPEP